MGIDRRRSTPWGTGPRWELTVGLLVLGLGAVVVGLVGAANPESTLVRTTKSFQEAGTLSYSGKAASDAIYADGRVHSGQSVISREVSDLDVQFDFNQDGDPAASGTVSLSAAVVTGQGLSRSLPLGPSQTFRGGHVTASAVIHPGDVETMVYEAQKAANQGFGSATLTITPSVLLHGVLHGEPFSTTFGPTFVFDVTGTALIPAAPPVSSGPAAVVYNGLLQATQSSGVPSTARRPNSVGLLFWHLPDKNARLVGVAGALLVLAALLFGLPEWRRRRRVSPEVRTAAQFGSMLVGINDLRDHFGPTVDMLSAADLKEVAERYESVVLMQRQGLDTVYSVWDNGVLYRYTQTGSEAPDSSGSGVDQVQTNDSVLYQS